MLDGEILNPIRAPVPLCLAFSSNLPSVMVGQWGVGWGMGGRVGGDIISPWAEMVVMGTFCRWGIWKEAAL